MNKRIIVFLLILASSLTMASMDLYAPSLAHLPDYFGTTAESIKLTMSLYILAYAVATLLHGPLSERFGRRPVLLWGLVGFTLASLLCALAQSAEQLILARIFQGVCAAVEGVLVLAIIRDLFDEQDQVKIIGLYGVATCVTPAVAPLIGGYVHVLFGWRMNFHLLFASGLIVAIAIWYYLEETADRDVVALKPVVIIKDYLGLLQNSMYMKYCIISGCSIATFFAFITAGPFILINNLGLRTEHFGYFQAFLVLGFAIGAFTANRMADKGKIEGILDTGIAILVLGAATLFVITWFGWETVNSLAIGMFLVVAAEGLIFSTTPTLSMKFSDSRTGSAAAMLVTLEMGIGSVAALAVGLFHDGSSRPLGLTIAALTLIAVACVFYRRGVTR